MYSNVSKELVFFITCVAAGFFCAFIYDILRISRRIVRVGDWVVNVEDVLFMVAAALIFFYASYLKNSGEIRWHSFIGGAAGVIVYISAVGNKLLDVSCLLIGLMLRAAAFLLKLLAAPILFVFRVLKKPISVVMWYSGKGAGKIGTVAGIGAARAKISLKNAIKILRGSR